MLLKRLRQALIGLLIGTFIVGATIVEQKKDPCNVRWEGAIDPLFLQTVRDTLEAASSCKMLRVDLLSPGGSVIHTLEVVHEMRKAEQDGLVIEIHGGAMIASGATFVMGAGSRGRRFVRRNSLALVHGVQSMSMFGQTCEEYKPNPATDSEKAINILITLMANEYAALSGKPLDEVLKWFRCDNTQAGFGELLVKLGLADYVEA